jgi:hypothetical protein
MDDQEHRDNALAKLQQFRSAAADAKDPIADEVAQALEEQRRSKARNKFIGAGKVLYPRTSIQISRQKLMACRV